MTNLLLHYYRHGVWACVLAWSLAIGGVLAGWWPAQPRGMLYLFATLALWALLAYAVRAARERFVREAALPQFLKRKLRDAYPHLAQKDAELVEQGLRQFFLSCLRSKRQFVAMPSRAVDVLWHEFILHTRAYQDWCQSALGFFLHHTPAEALGRRAKHNDGLRRAWYWACKQEDIDPRAPLRLPLLFAVDAQLGIANGFFYLPDCSDIARKNAAGDSGGTTYCGTDFADASYDGSSDDFGGAESTDGSSGDGDGGSDGGGDGGGGCGGD
ncbi:glycine-rich domain-containing protein [Giesbergeria anulus]|uniref:Uncharacterized protein n=1 Tax=Giesbergeria anulus TaxID=180197 RepID=A0A1H9P645_9BURK|nr:hypothetical protein [Giesbergeria anulus]SER43774.1 hypothetical protein SAMN02982919_02385 [Giesbergeria anulus]